jgi:predicted nucleic acid-binding protein
MTLAHVFVETNFLFGIFCLPSKRHRDALALKARFEAREIQLYLPYLCFQEARHIIARSLRSNWCSDLLEFHRFADAAGTATWDFAEVRKLLDAATGEVSKAKAVYQPRVRPARHPRHAGMKADVPDHPRASYAVGRRASSWRSAASMGSWGITAARRGRSARKRSATACKS